MRPIKFRAWDILAKRMRYLNEELCSIPYYELFCHTPDSRAMNLMQFTGIKDKNGREIFEGDILSNLARPAFQVYFESGAFNCGSDNGSKSKIIGNIYENPELLTQPNQESEEE